MLILFLKGAYLESKNDPEEKGGATPLLLASHNGQLPYVLTELYTLLQETYI